MSTNIFRGDAPAVSQVSTLTITANDSGSTYAITVSNRIISCVGQASTTATASYLNSLVASFQPSYAEFNELTLTYASDNVVTFGATTPGLPFVLTSSVSGGTGAASLVAVTLSAGPNDWSTAANWSLGAIPANTDDVVIANTATDILYGLAQSGVALTSLTIASTYTGKIGLPDINASGNYYEYRTKYLTIGATTINVGDQVYGGIGSGRIKLAPGSHTTTFNVYGTGTPFDSGLPALLINGSGSNYTLNLLSGSIGVALDVGSSATLPTVRVGYENSISTDVVLTLGAGCTTTTISQYGGTITTSAGLTTWNLTAGTATVLGSAAVTTVTMWPATGQTASMWYESTGTIATLTLAPNSSISFERDLRGRTVTNSTLYTGSKLLDGFRTVTFSNPTQFYGDPFQIGISRGSTYTMQL